MSTSATISAPAVGQTIADQIRKHQQGAESQYRDLVRRIVGGVPFNLEGHRATIEGAGRSFEDFERDVETLKARIEAGERLKKVPQIEAEKAKANKLKVKRSDELESLRKEYRERLKQAEMAYSDASDAERNLDDEIRSIRRESQSCLLATADDAITQEMIDLEERIEQDQNSLFSTMDYLTRATNALGIDRMENADLIRQSMHSPSRELVARVESLKKRQAELEGSLKQARHRLETIEKEKLDPFKQRWASPAETNVDMR